ncbi:MAG: YjbH domain-containing protein [Legionella sp.]|nr:MAG: YjbH domain-containing protein [Legionella sp.]
MRIYKIYRIFFRSFLGLFLSSSLMIAAPSKTIEDIRLSQWLIQHNGPDDYLSGLMWLVPEEKSVQATLKQNLLDELASYQKHAGTEQKKVRFSRLMSKLHRIPITGRAFISIPDPLWLELHPAQDPILRQGQLFSLPKQPQSVTVLLEDGSLCQTPFIPSVLAKTYIKKCIGINAAVDYVWIAQPDGRTLFYGIAIWNEETQDPPMPGAWIWAPKRHSKINKHFSKKLIGFLATQGVAPDESSIYFPEINIVKDVKFARNAQYTSNDWGMIGLLQMPSARMEREGEVRFQGTSVYPYDLGTVAFQPFNWLEGSFRYVRIRNRLYGPKISKLLYMDKSFDVKLKILRESAYLPELSIGAQDMAGSGLFSGEYIAANKRIKDFDWTLGIGWGSLGAQANILNPLSILNSNFNSRINDIGVGGKFIWNSYFRGPAALFGGLVWHTPWDPLLFKMEYNSSAYQLSPKDLNFNPQKSPINLGLVYRFTSNIDLMSAYERGNTVMLGFTLHTSLSKLEPIKIFDPEIPPILASQPLSMPNWTQTVSDIHQLTGWSVKNIKIVGDSLHVQIDDTFNSYRGTRFEKLIALLHRDAPENIKRFVLIFSEYGMNLDAKEINRAIWVQQHLEALPPSLVVPPITSFAPESSYVYSKNTKSNRPLWQSKRMSFSGDIAPSFSQIIGGPDGYILYQAGVFASGAFTLDNSSFLSGVLAVRLIDNYDHFVYDGPSDLPRVRTDMRQYILTSPTTIPNLQLSHMEQISKNQFVSIYGGLLEPMFAGVGAEWLYRPWHSPLAVGIDFNLVQQRGFAQDFSLQDYKVGTGQVTLYWNTGWSGILTQLSAGQYLAGDRGVEIDISRTFKNGVVIGAYASKTNVTAEEFGEGGFNKGIYVIVPFDDILPISTPGNAYFGWQPLLRDGGAELNRYYPLYAMTAIRQ